MRLFDAEISEFRKQSNSEVAWFQLAVYQIAVITRYIVAVIISTAYFLNKMWLMGDGVHFSILLG